MSEDRLSVSMARLGSELHCLSQRGCHMKPTAIREAADMVAAMARECEVLERRLAAAGLEPDVLTAGPAGASGEQASAKLFRFPARGRFASIHPSDPKGAA